jgi:hypothetical protein
MNDSIDTRGGREELGSFSYNIYYLWSGLGLFENGLELFHMDVANSRANTKKFKKREKVESY